jgi:hypothetical protein
MCLVVCVYKHVCACWLVLSYVECCVRSVWGHVCQVCVAICVPPLCLCILCVCSVLARVCVKCVWLYVLVCDVCAPKHVSVPLCLPACVSVHLCVPACG